MITNNDNVKVNILSLGRLPEGMTGPLMGVTVPKTYYNLLKGMGYSVELLEKEVKEVKKPAKTISVKEPIKVKEEVIPETVEDKAEEITPIVEEKVSIEPEVPMEEIINKEHEEPLEDTVEEETSEEDINIEEEESDSNEEEDASDDTKEVNTTSNTSKKKKKKKKPVTTSEE